MDDTGPAKTFDQELVELENIVARLEGGELPLEEALTAFETGVALVRSLTKRLNEAEGRIELLTRDANGALRLQPLPPESTKP